MWKIRSEPILPLRSESSLLYRTNKVEVIAKPAWGEFRVKDWYIVARPAVTRTPHIAFIASLGIASSKEKQSEQEGIELAGMLTSERLSHQRHLNNTLVEPVHVNRICKRIAHRRGRPWEILYDCSLQDFYNVAFAWSENALFDVDGKASVRSMQSR
ncbi:unnamed protein product [Toxocara canis]|uniref:Uncharacterized protein n=1 Tax=Toxocara canis TaxID=6265 RepID=A0A3P7G164_TOXCA|nr:unnamed protein product [Toxocara canis]